MQVENNILLSEFTTIKLGGNAKHFCRCESENDIIECLEYARQNNLKLQVLGGGSNIIFQDNGFNGIVLHSVSKGISVFGKGASDEVEITVQAGEEWDSFVLFCVSEGFCGIESLSGIPGNAGAVPIQNVGAYGSDVSKTIIDVTAVNRITREKTKFTNEECKFGYRNSRFKNKDKDKYIITEVKFKLIRNGNPEIEYPELKKHIAKNYFMDSEADAQKLFDGLSNPVEKLKIVRNAVLDIRKKKGMVIDEKDEDSVSCGSFFVNPVLTKDDYKEFELIIHSEQKNYGLFEIPHFEVPEGIKISAAWLIDNAGFHKGYTKEGAGISSKHNLALINKGGTTRSLLNLAKEIEQKVFKQFGIKLEREPIII